MDRNRLIRSLLGLLIWSLSARRAWIEILSRDADGAYLVVALRKESVDRNTSCTSIGRPKRLVALRKESVDRN